VNSNWTKKEVEKYFNINSIVLYPPVLSDFPEVPFEKKDNGFVCLSRISPVKRIKNIIKIISEVRASGFDMHLHIIGPIGDSSYYKEIKQIQERNKWIILEGVVSRQKLSSIVSSHKYGINGRRDEHFGISVVEMVKAGCIVFVPNGGGQVEIINNQKLIYNNDKEAVEKIIAVFKDKGLQIELRKKLFENSKKFSTENFMNSVRKIILENG
jgi:glycosyltransferase involved in cell wall biosynthesis